MQKRFGAFSSSENPLQLADTVKGVLGFIALVVSAPATASILPLIGVDLAPETIAESINSIGTGVGLVLTNAIIVFGVFKKLFVFLYDKIANR